MAKKDANTTMPTNTAYANGAQVTVTNLENPGQMGYAPDFRYYHGAADYTRRPTIAFILEFPAAFALSDSPDKWQGALKSLIEMHARSITGIDFTLEVEHVENPFGGSGEMMQTLAKVRRARSTPQFEWVEKLGMPVARFWNNYILYFMGHPDNNVAGIIAKGGVTPQASYPDFNSFTVLFVEPDPSERYCQQAVIITNMQPTGQGPRMEMGRDITSTPESVTHSLTFTGIQQVGRGVDKLGQMFLDRANQQGLDLNNRPAFLDDREADVAARNGYIEQVVTTLQHNGVSI